MMNKEVVYFLVILLGLSLIFWGVHYLLVSHFFPVSLYYPIWAIYLFNLVLVLIMYGALQFSQRKRPEGQLKLFLWLTTLKMLAAMVFLLPLFMKKTAHITLEAFNFFIPYFIYLILEIRALNRVLQKS
jgi:uncharacterized membrane protein SirB2